MHRQLVAIVRWKRSGTMPAPTLTMMRSMVRQLARDTQPKPNTLEVMETYRVMKAAGEPEAGIDLHRM